MASIIDTIKTRVLETLNLTTQGSADTRAARAYEAGYSDGNDDPVSGTVKSFGYRRATTNGPRDFTQVPYDKAVETVWSLFQSNPLAKRMLKMKINHYLGGGIEFKSDDEQVDEQIREQWQLNKLDREFRKRAFDLRLWGEQIYPAFVREADGQTRLGYIDVGSIETIIPHPDNIIELYAVVLKEDQAASRRKVYRVIRKDESFVRKQGIIESVVPAKNEGLMVTANPDQATIQDWEREMLRGYGLSEYTGAVLLFQVNNVSNQTRGFSDLLQSCDWIDILDDTLFAVGEREQFASYFSWDVTLEGADDEQVKVKSKALQKSPPKRGSVRTHNEKETWAMNWPDLKQMGSIETVKAILAFILGGFGIPMSWYGFADGTNRATALAQGEPAHRMMEEEQDEIRDMILDILTLFRDQAIIAGTLGKDKADAEISVTMPAMTTKDIQAITQSMSQLATALVVAEEKGWSSQEQVIEVWQKTMAEFGVEPDDINDLIKQATDVEQARDEARRQILLMNMQSTNGKDQPVNGKAELMGGKAPEVDPKTVLNGAQVASALDIVVKVKQGILSYEQGLEALQIFFNLTLEQARRILGKPGEKLPEEQEENEQPKENQQA